MELSLIVAMVIYGLSMSISPGPVNMVAISAGVNYGFKPTLPYVFGAALGFTVLLAAIGLGLSQLVQHIPQVLNVLAYLGTAFICYLGYKIATANTDIDTHAGKQPSFAQGYLLQSLNPKAWIAGLSGVSAFGAADSLFVLLIFCTLYFFLCYFAIGVWVFLGSRLTDVMVTPARLTLFNRMMGLALVAVAFYLLYIQIFGL